MSKDSRGFTLIELLIVVAVVGIIAAIAIPGLLRSRISANEASAIGSMRTINSAQATFSATCGGGGYAVDLADLGLGPTAGGDGFIPPDIAGASPAGVPKSGYEFTLSAGSGVVVIVAGDTCNGSSNDTESEYFVIADPVAPGATGVRYFGSDHTAYLRQDTAQLSDMTDGQPLQ